MQLGFEPHYVLDEMPLYEAEIFLSEAYRSKMEGWEQARMIAYIVAQCNSTKRLKPTDIMKFDWDDAAHEEEHDTKISNEDIARLKAKAEQFLKENNNGERIRN